MAGKIFINYRRDDSPGTADGCMIGSPKCSGAITCLWTSTTFRLACALTVVVNRAEVGHGVRVALVSGFLTGLKRRALAQRQRMSLC
jgi:hypothetical protein